MIGTMISHYLIVEKLGQGGMGVVYRAEDRNLNRQVAVKVLPDVFAGDPERLARFEREAKLLASLNHPNIAAIYGLEESDGKHFLVLELVEGETLAQIMAKGTLPAEEALDVCRQIAEGLEAAHEKGVIHRDLKPANVKITPEGRVKVLDFGLAKLFHEEQAATDATQSPTLTDQMTRAGVILGTAAYMSPEQAKGKYVDKRTDIWAFGCVLYEMLTGRQAFTGETVTDLLAAVMKTEPDWNALPASTPAATRRLLRRTLEKDPRARLRDIGEARIALEARPEPPTELPPPVNSQSRRREKWAWTAAGLMLIGLLAALLLVIAYLRQAPAEAHIMKFPLPPPEKASFGSIAVSPDGRWLAFTAATGGKVQLWVRALDALAAHVLPGTEGAMYPFWSPDSRSIGFFTAGKLKRIDVSGGSAQTLCDTEGTGNGGTWSRERVIVFASLTIGLYRVSATGGAATLMMPIDRTQQESNYHSPSFLPDGRHFLYYIVCPRKEHFGTYVGSLDGGVKQRLLDAESNALYAPSLDPGIQAGYLLFMREDALMAQSFDVRQLKLAGEPFPIGEGSVGRDPSIFSQFNFSVSHSGVLIYDPSLDRQRKRIVWADRQGNQLRGHEFPGSFGKPGLSPDEQRIVIDRVDRQTDGRDLWLYEVASGDERRLTFSPASDIFPIWSPDGSRIVWVSNREAAFDLYQKAASGAGQDDLLLKSGLPKFTSDWSPDGRFVIYSQLDPKTKRDVWVLPLFGDRKPYPYLQTEANEAAARLSPDGRWMAYVSDELGTFEVYVQSFPSGAGKWQISASGGVGPHWRRDGRELFYYSSDGKLMAAEVKSGAVFEAGPSRALFEFRSGNGVPLYAPYEVTANGQRFLLNTLVDESGGAPLTVVVNWNAGLKK